MKMFLLITISLLLCQISPAHFEIVTCPANLGKNNAEAIEIISRSNHAKKILDFLEKLSSTVPTWGYSFYARKDLVSEMLQLGKDNIASWDNVIFARRKLELESIFRISRLTSFESAELAEIRATAAHLLSSLVDNANMCGVLDSLLEDNLSDKTQLILLQAIKMATDKYLLAENVQLTKHIIRLIRPQIEGDSAKERTLDAIKDIELNLRKKGEGPRERIQCELSFNDSVFAECATLPRLKAILEPPVNM